MLDNLIILLILLILGMYLFLQLYLFLQQKQITGGSCGINVDLDKKIPMDHYVIDGQNMLHTLFVENNPKAKMQAADFTTYMEKISKVLNTALPDKDIHIVTKNFENDELKKITEKTVVKYQSISTLLALSKKFKKITYHVAFDLKAKKRQRHHALARDDILCIHLAKSFDGQYCIITNDKLKDFSDFKKTNSFIHFIIKNGKIKNNELINPQKLSHNPPLHCFNFAFYSAKDENPSFATMNGNIYKKLQNVPCMYLKY